jgi:hypothetical protein
MSSLSKSRSIVVAFVCVAMLVLAVSLVMGACGGKASIVGKWSDPTDNSVTEFTADGKVVADALGGAAATYTDVDGKVTVTALGQTVLAFTYTIKGDTMTATDASTGDKTELTRVK